MKKINLNLLRVLNALLSEGSVTRAAQTLGITQSAASLALKQLRELYNDVILVKGAKGHMQLTKFAKKLITPTKEAMKQNNALLSITSTFDPTQCEHVFHIGITSNPANVLLAKLTHRVMRVAPCISIIYHEISSDHYNKLNQRYDLIVSDFHKPFSHLKSCSLYHDQEVIIADKQHPIFRSEKIHPKLISNYSFISMNEVVQNSRLIGSSLMVTLQTLKGSLLLAKAPKKVLEPLLEIFHLTALELPTKTQLSQIKLFWHAEDHSDQANKWMREIIKYVSKKLI